MKKSIDERLVDEAIEAYVDWREERVSVWDAYERWACGPLEDASFAFSAYRAALDREERASDVYAGLMTRVATAPSAMPPSPQEPTVYDTGKAPGIVRIRRAWLFGRRT